jgi:hypothetical protein
MPPQDEGGVFISTRDIYDKLTLAIEELRRIAVQMESTQADSADKETRIRALERWKYGLPIATLIALASLVTTLSRNAGK